MKNKRQPYLKAKDHHSEVSVQRIRLEMERANPLHPELFSLPRYGHLVNTPERRKGEERALVKRYLELADIVLKGSAHEDDSQSLNGTTDADKKTA